MNYPSELQQKMAAASMVGAAQISHSVMSQYDNSINSALPPAQRPSTEIESCLSRANNALERLHGRISAIEDRVRPVMRSTGTGQSGSSGKPQESLSPLGDALTSMESRIDSACDRLEALLLGLAL